MAEVDDQAIVETVLALLHARAAGCSICPSEVARALAPHEACWRALMPTVRRVAAHLAKDGVIDATQQGRRVQMARATGPVRLQRGPSFPGHGVAASGHRTTRPG